MLSTSFSIFVVSSFLISKLVFSEKILANSVVNGTETYHITSSTAGDDIVCSTLECNIICDSKLSCYKLNIYGEESNILSLDCDGELSCSDIRIINGAKDMNDIYCSNKSSCYNADIDLSNTSIVNIICNYSWLSSKDALSTSTYKLRAQSPCHSAVIKAENAGHINVECDAYGCFQAQFKINASYSAEFSFFGKWSSWEASISDTYMEKELIINCYEGYSCGFMDIYCPFSAQCTINCLADAGCTSGSNVYIVNRTYDKLDVNFAGSDVTSDINFKCIGNGPTGTSVVKINSVGSRYICNEYDGFGCCPNQFATDIYVCEDGKDCNYECNADSMCQNVIINGSQATSLSVICNGEDSCKGSKIICPSSDYSSCKIECGSYYHSCEEITIEANKANLIDEFSFICNDGLAACSDGWLLFDFEEANTINMTFNSGWPVLIDTMDDRISLIKNYNFNCSQGCEYSMGDDVWLAPFTKDDVVVNDLNIYCAECKDGVFNLSITNSMDLACDESIGIVESNGCAGEFNIILLDKSANVDIKCYGLIGWNVGPCNGYFNIISSELVNDNLLSIACYESSGCSFGTFRFTNINKVNMQCMGQYSCRASTIYAMDANELQLNCNGYKACKQSDIFCPYHDENVCQINCNDYTDVCNDMQFLVNHQYKYNYLQLTLPQDTTCWDLWTYSLVYCFDIAFNCYGDKNDKLNTTLILDDNYKCDESSSSYCCPWNKTYTATPISTTSIKTTKSYDDETNAAFWNQYNPLLTFTTISILYAFSVNN